MEVTHFEPNLALFSVVQILSQNGLKKTLKRLRKETKCKKLKEKFIPEEVRKLNFEKIISKKIKKLTKNDLNNIKNKHKVDKDKRNGDKLVYNKFIKSSTLLSNNHTSNDSEYTNNNIEIKDNNEISNRLNDNLISNGLEKDKLQKNNNNHFKDNLDVKDNLNSFKGKDFRNQKNKKKRSSWKGSGQINECVNSFIFSDSDS